MTRAALITGAGTGIGASTALALAADGLAVALVGRRREPLEAVAEQIGERAHVVVGDIVTDAPRIVRKPSRRSAACTWWSTTRARSAATCACTSSSSRPGTSRSRSTSPGTSSSCTPRSRTCSRADGDRSIVNVGSTLAHKLVPGIGAYAAAKGGIVSLTKALAVEYGPDGIRANAVMPAVVETPLAHTDRPDFEQRKDGMATAYPLRRLGQPEDVARSDRVPRLARAAWTSGTIVDVDGGFSVT